MIPPHYIANVRKALTTDYVDCFGGPDAAHAILFEYAKIYQLRNDVLFIQRAEIRGGNEALGKFQPRSFNMGISKAVFETVGGYGKHYTPGGRSRLEF